MKDTTCNTDSTSSNPTLESILDKTEILTIDRRKIPNHSGYDDYESRLGEAMCLTELLKELVCPTHLRHPDYPGSEHTLIPFDSSLLEGKAREGLGYIIYRIQDTLQDSYDALYNRTAEVDKQEVDHDHE